MRFFTLWALLVLDPRLMHQSSLQKPLRTCSDRQIWSSEKAQLRSGAAARTTPASTMLFRMSTGLPVLVHRRLPVATSNVAPRSFTNPNRTASGRWMKTGWTQNHRPRCKTDATSWKVHNSFSMKFGWRILMKSSQFIFNENWMTNLDEKSIIHFRWNVDGKSWWKVRNSFSMKCGWQILDPWHCQPKLLDHCSF